jgi:transcriptional regulator with XRE-family HTH domain
MNIDELFARIDAENPGSREIAHEVDPPFFLAWNVYAYRTRRGLTQAQLAEAIGVAQPRIARIERGDANPRLMTLARIAHALGITLPELLADNIPQRAVPHAASAVAAGDLPIPQRKRRVG